MRSYQHQCIRSYQNSAVKRSWTRVVLGWVTSKKVLVLNPSFFLLKMYDSRTFRPWRQTWHVIPFRKSQRELSDEWGRKIEFFFCCFSLLQILTLMYFSGLFVIFAILQGENHMLRHCFRIFCMYQNSYKQDRVFLHRWWDPRQIDHKIFKKE